MKKQQQPASSKRAKVIINRCIPVVFSSLTAIVPFHVIAEQYFNPAFLSSDPSAVADLERFNQDGGQAPGSYRVDVYINGSFIAAHDITFKSAKEASDLDKVAVASAATMPKNNISTDDSSLTPFLTIKELEAIGVNVKAIPTLRDLPEDKIVGVEKSIPDAKAFFDFEKQRLDLSIPQISMKNDARGYIPPEQWDEGINALLLNYNFTGNESSNDGKKESDKFLSLQSGINLGAWRLRDNSSWSSTSSDNNHTSDFQHISTYVERTIIPFKSELVAGDTSTSGDVFDSNPIRGVQISSDDNMLPDSQKGFAPTIRGIAKSNAKVTIKQNNYVIYQTYVAPGAFEINDLFPTSSSGDLQVLVEENDGSINSYNVPFSGVPVLQREGRIKYAVSAGKYRNGGDQQDTSTFEQATMLWGLPYGITAYGGAQLSNNYRSLALGIGKNFGDLGAFSIDITQANSTLVDDSKHQGQSMRFLYAKTLNEFGTNFRLLGYRYSTEGFYTLSDTMYKRMSGYNDSESNNNNNNNKNNVPEYFDYYNLNYTKRGKLEANISQQIGEDSNIYLSGSQQSYWHTDETDTLLQVGFSSMAWGATYSVAYNYNKSQGQPEADQIFSLNVSIPLSQWLSPDPSNAMQSAHNAFLTYNNSRDNKGNMTQQAGLAGTLLDNNNLSYSVSQGYGNNDVGNSGAVSGSYQGGYGNANVGYNYSSGYKQVNYGLSGGIVAHRHGITLGQPLGDTNVLIEAPGADNVGVENNTGVKTDWRGYAIVPYASTYRQNRIALDTTTLNSHTDIDDAVVNVVPTQGAIVRATFNAHVGIKALITLTHNGKPLPFGASVSREDVTGSGIVGDAGQVYMTGLPLTGTLKSQWGKDANAQCEATYTLPEDSLEKAITYITAICK
ncbi:outer membrane usher protein FimD [Obesumbacterium proteus]|uniref:fimbrial biogenesis usher protein n=1 Tax=Obesumbacterium proteus TaxID=82983 RepID=UPI0010335008|nr:fimbrial biogenesis usher protein [Obesumbacterium proteus]TBL73485.1 outer membrane usher protein FimD [Obesumbacterium proteus]